MSILGRIIRAGKEMQELLANRVMKYEEKKNFYERQQIDYYNNPDYQVVIGILDELYFLSNTWNLLENEEKHA